VDYYKLEKCICFQKFHVVLQKIHAHHPKDRIYGVGNFMQVNQSKFATTAKRAIA
jgi:hypothetical protein